MRTKPPCWPNDPDYLDGRTKIDLPSEKLLKAYWGIDILDPEEEPAHRIIDADDDFKVRFRLELVGDLWTCVCGDWWFDLRFTPIGEGTGFDLSKKLGTDKFWVKGWKGCDTKCIELVPYSSEHASRRGRWHPLRGRRRVPVVLLRASGGLYRL